MTAARDIIRELQALGARLEADGERLVLHAGSRAIPQPLVQQARGAKRAILALLGATIAPSAPAGNRDGLSDPPVTKNRLAALANYALESRRNANDLLRPPFGGLSGGVSSENRGGISERETLAVLAGDPETQDLRHLSLNYAPPNLSVSGGEDVETPKTATPKPVLAILGNRQDFCGAHDDFSPKTATRSCRKGPLGPSRFKIRSTQNLMKRVVLQPQVLGKVNIYAVNVDCRSMNGSKPGGVASACTAAAARPGSSARRCKVRI